MTDAKTANQNSAVKKLKLDSGDEFHVLNRGHHATLGMYDQSNSRTMPDASPRDLRKIAKALTETADAIDGGVQTKAKAEDKPAEKAAPEPKKPDIKATADARKSTAPAKPAAGTATTAKGSAKKSK